MEPDSVVHVGQARKGGGRKNAVGLEILDWSCEDHTAQAGGNRESGLGPAAPPNRITVHRSGQVENPPLLCLRCHSQAPAVAFWEIWWRNKSGMTYTLTDGGRERERDFVLSNMSC